MSSSTAQKPGAYLSDPSLYYRNMKDFIYTVQVFETVLDRSKLSKFFNNTEDIDAGQLYDDSGKIKPAGGPGDEDDLSTIYGTVESWSGEKGENDASTNDKKGQKVTKKVLDDAKKNHYQTMKDIPKEKYKEGSIVYVDFKEHNSAGFNEDDWVDTWLVYKNGKWEKLGV